MDIGSIGVQQLNQAHVPFSSSGLSASAPGSNFGEPGGFAELLKRAQLSEAPNSIGNAVPSPASGKLPINKNDKLYELCLELETFLVKNLIRSMRNTVQKSNLIDTGFAGQMYEDMLYDEYAKDFTKNANFGFAEMAYRDLSRFTS